MSTMFGHSEQPGLNCARRGSGICSDWAGENWGTVRPHTAKLRKGRAGGSTFKDQGTSVALTLPLSAPAGMGRAIHMQSSPSRGRRGVWWRAHSRTSRAASGGHHGPCWTRPCSVQESRRSWESTGVKRQGVRSAQTTQEPLEVLTLAKWLVIFSAMASPSPTPSATPTGPSNEPFPDFQEHLLASVWSMRTLFWCIPALALCSWHISGLLRGLFLNVSHELITMNKCQATTFFQTQWWDKLSIFCEGTSSLTETDQKNVKHHRLTHVTVSLPKHPNFVYRFDQAW